MDTRYIFVTGGVVSSLGKGIMGEQISGEMSKALKKEIVNKAFAAGVGLRQLARISNISYGMINSTRKQSSN